MYHWHVVARLTQLLQHHTNDLLFVIISYSLTKRIKQYIYKLVNVIPCIVQRMLYNLRPASIFQDSAELGNVPNYISDLRLAENVTYDQHKTCSYCLYQNFSYKTDSYQHIHLTYNAGARSDEYSQWKTRIVRLEAALLLEVLYLSDSIKVFIASSFVNTLMAPWNKFTIDHNSCNIRMLLMRKLSSRLQ